MLTIRNTSIYPADEVVNLVRFAISELDMSRVHINVKNSQHPRRGRAYYYVPNISNAPSTASYLITIGIGSGHWPREEGYWNSGARKAGKPRRGGRWPEITINDWREQLVHTAAHEAKHIDARKERVRQSEVACEHFACYMVRRYRAEMQVGRMERTVGHERVMKGVSTLDAERAGPAESTEY